MRLAIHSDLVEAHRHSSSAIRTSGRVYCRYDASHHGASRNGEAPTGRGLGMSIVNQIITLAGGFIQVDSYLGEGTRVRLYLPRIAGNE